MNNCSRIFSNHLVCVVLLFVIFGQGNACKFPRYLETSAIWTATYSDKSTFQGYFQGNLLKASRCDTEGQCFQFTRKCLSKLDNNKYQVQHLSGGVSKPIMYLCMQILERGRSIIQIRESQELYYRNPNSCNDEHLILDNWPMVTTENFEEQKIACPFSGGYNIRLHTSDKQPKCDKEIIPARLESECEQGDGMKINFHKRDCLEKDLEMQVEQSLYCVATWTHGNFTFVILRPQNDDFKAWCMRITGTDFSKPIEHGHLFVDLVCDPGDGNGNIRETSKYLYLEFTQRIISSTCADSYARICDDNRLCVGNDEIYAVNCRRFCNLCSGEQNLCTFPGSLQGNWVKNSKREQNEVRISYYDIDISSTGRFQCQESEGHDFENRTMLLQTFPNGCYPRYACFEVKKVSSSILQYRLGNRVSWPVKNWDKLKENVCSDQKFEPSARDKEMFGRSIEEKPTTILVDMEHHYPVDCDLQNWPGLLEERLYMQEVNKCEYCFIYDVNNKRGQEKFIAQPFNCTSSIKLERQDYHCLGVFPQDENTYAVVTRTMHVHQEYLCWVFVHDVNRDDTHGVVYVLEATNCNRIAINAVREGNLDPLRTLIIPKSRVKCPYIDQLLPTTTPEYYPPTPVHEGWTKKPDAGVKTPEVPFKRTTYYDPVYTDSTRRNFRTTLQPPLYDKIDSGSAQHLCCSTFSLVIYTFFALAIFT